MTDLARAQAEFARLIPVAAIDADAMHVCRQLWHEHGPRVSHPYIDSLTDAQLEELLARLEADAPRGVVH